MRVRLQCLSQHQTPISDVLSFVSSTWDRACRTSEEVHGVNLTHITIPTIHSDEVLAVQATILLRQMETKVDVLFEVKVGGEGLEIETGVTTVARVVYGEALNEGKMGEFLAQKIGRERWGWVKAIRELEGKLVARGKRDT